MNTEVFDIASIILLLIIIYPYAGYPFLLQILARIKGGISSEQPGIIPAPPYGQDGKPLKIAVLIAAYNEADYIADAIHSVFRENYPVLEVHVGSDGSTDNTCAVIKQLMQEYSGLHLHDLSRRGKNKVNEYLVAHSDSDLIFHLDADCRMLPGTLWKMAAHYQSPQIGGVLAASVESQEEYLHRMKLGGGAEHAHYKSFEAYTRIRESLIASTVTSLGHCYSLRRQFRLPLPNDQVCDDYMPILGILLARKKVIMEPGAHVVEIRIPPEGGQFQQAQRFAACGIASVLHAKQLLSPGYGWVALFLWSRKMLRWLLPFMLLFLLLLSGIGAYLGSMFCMGLISFMLMPVLLGLPALAGINIFPFRQAYIFLRLNGSLIAAWAHILRQKQSALWERPI
jgi:glycosyltransferase involved in cell wall biosynthesis